MAWTALGDSFEVRIDSIGVGGNRRAYFVIKVQSANPMLSAFDSNWAEVRVVRITAERRELVKGPEWGQLARKSLKGAVGGGLSREIEVFGAAYGVVECVGLRYGGENGSGVDWIVDPLVFLLQGMRMVERPLLLRPCVSGALLGH